MWATVKTAMKPPMMTRNPRRVVAAAGAGVWLVAARAGDAFVGVPDPALQENLQAGVCAHAHAGAGAGA